MALNHSYTYKVGYSRNFVPSFVWQNENLKVDGNLFSATSTSRYDSVKKGQVSNLLNTLSARGNYSASRSDWMHQDWQIQQIDGVLNVSLVYQHAEARQFMNQEVGNDQHPA